MRRTIGSVAFAALLTSVVVLVPSADRAPDTRTHETAVGERPVDVAFPIDYVGVRWDGPTDPAGAAVRFAHGGRWGPWQPLVEDGAHLDGDGFESGLVWGDDADAYQVRAPADARRPKAMAIDTTSGGRRASAADAGTTVVTRAQWGADESIRKGTPTYYAAQKLTVHHTATRNDDTDPAATVRAIYAWHVNGNGWDDIGYQYLVDESGRVYEGRWSGSDGDPAHDASGRVVTGAHVGGMNSGNVGIALLGTLTDRGPTASARAATEQLLRELTARHGIDPQGASTYVNPVSGATRTLPNIPGHRDWEATECPGGSLYALLPSIRASVAAAPAPSPTTTTTESTSTTTSSTSTSTTTTTTSPTPTTTTTAPTKAPKKRR